VDLVAFAVKTKRLNMIQTFIKRKPLCFN